MDTVETVLLTSACYSKHLHSQERIANVHTVAAKQKYFVQTEATLRAGC